MVAGVIKVRNVVALVVVGSVEFLLAPAEVEYGFVVALIEI